MKRFIPRRYKPGEVTRCMDLVHMKILRGALDAIAAWPRKEFGDKQRMYPKHIVLQIYFMSTFVGLVDYIRTRYHTLSFMDLGRNLINTFMDICSNYRLSMINVKKYRDMVKEFVEHVHLYHYKDQSEYAMMVFNKITKILTVMSIFLETQVYIGLSFFNIWPFMNNYANGMFSSDRPMNTTFDHSVYYTTPFPETSMYTYILVHISNWFMSYYCTCTFYACDMLACVIAANLWGHMEIFKNNLITFPRPKQDPTSESNMLSLRWYTEDENRKVSKLLIGLIKHHLMFKGFMDKTLDTLGIMLCLYYLIHQIIGCILLLELSVMSIEAFGKFGLLTLIIFQQLIMISCVFEILATNNESLLNSVYRDLPWQAMNVRNRRTVLIFMTNLKSSETVVLMVPLGVRTMASILKNSVSYFIMLRTIAMSK